MAQTEAHLIFIYIININDHIPSITVYDITQIRMVYVGCQTLRLRHKH